MVRGAGCLSGVVAFVGFVLVVLILVVVIFAGLDRQLVLVSGTCRLGVHETRQWGTAMMGACSGGVNARTRRTLKKFFWVVAVFRAPKRENTAKGKRSTPEEGKDITAGSLPDLPDGENDPHRREPLFVPYVASGGVAYWYFLVEDVPCRSQIVHERVEVSQVRAACA